MEFVLKKSFAFFLRSLVITIFLSLNSGIYPGSMEYLRRLRAS
jgi:hypothetical protein